MLAVQSVHVAKPFPNSALADPLQVLPSSAQMPPPPRSRLRRAARWGVLPFENGARRTRRGVSRSPVLPFLPPGAIHQCHRHPSHATCCDDTQVLVALVPLGLVRSRCPLSDGRGDLFLLPLRATLPLTTESTVLLKIKPRRHPTRPNEG